VLISGGCPPSAEEELSATGSLFLVKEASSSSDEASHADVMGERSCARRESVASDCQPRRYACSVALIIGV
jgi:hypothetical protein